MTSHQTNTNEEVEGIHGEEDWYRSTETNRRRRKMKSMKQHTFRSEPGAHTLHAGQRTHPSSHHQTSQSRSTRWTITLWQWRLLWILKQCQKNQQLVSQWKKIDIRTSWAVLRWKKGSRNEETNERVVTSIYLLGYREVNTEERHRTCYHCAQKSCSWNVQSGNHHRARSDRRQRIARSQREHSDADTRNHQNHQMSSTLKNHSVTDQQFCRGWWSMQDASCPDVKEVVRGKRHSKDCMARHRHMKLSHLVRKCWQSESPQISRVEWIPDTKVRDLAWNAIQQCRKFHWKCTWCVLSSWNQKIGTAAQMGQRGRLERNWSTFDNDRRHIDIGQTRNSFPAIAISRNTNPEGKSHQATHRRIRSQCVMPRFERNQRQQRAQAHSDRCRVRIEKCRRITPQGADNGEKWTGKPKKKKTKVGKERWKEKGKKSRWTVNGSVVVVFVVFFLVVKVLKCCPIRRWGTLGGSMMCLSVFLFVWSTWLRLLMLRAILLRFCLRDFNWIFLWRRPFLSPRSAAPVAHCCVNSRKVQRWISKGRPSGLCLNQSGEDPRRKVRFAKHYPEGLRSGAPPPPEGTLLQFRLTWPGPPKEPPAEVKEMDVDDTNPP